MKGFLDPIYQPRLVFSTLYVLSTFWYVITLVFAFNALLGKHIFRHEKEASAQWYYDL